MEGHTREKLNRALHMYLILCETVQNIEPTHQYASEVGMCNAIYW